MGLEGKTAIITGGAAGIGKAIALRLAADGAAIAILDVAVEAAQETVKELEAAGAKAMAVECDITDYAQTKEAVAAIASAMGWDRHPGEQRRHRQAAALRRDRRGAVGPDDRHQLQGLSAWPRTSSSPT